MEVSIREMKNSLSKYLKLVQAGKSVVITDRGRPVAQLTCMARTPAEDKAEHLRFVQSLPWVRPGKGGKVKGSKNPIRHVTGEKALSEMILEDRT
jgi:prevent-host-death family protein